VVAAERRLRWEKALSDSGSHPHLLLMEFDEDDQDRPPLHLDQTEQRIDWSWNKFNRQVNRLGWLLDDRVPYLDCITGTEIFAAAFGCHVEYPQDNMPFARPLVHSPEDADRLETPTLDAPTLAQIFSIADELKSRAGSDAVLRLPDIQSPMDIAGIVWDKNDFFISIVEKPDAVRALAAKARSLLVAFLDEWFRRYGSSFVAHYPDYYMPFGITLSEDEIGSVGPEVFDSMFLPELQFLSSRYGAIGIHCCANAEHQWRGFQNVQNLRVLNLNQPVDVTSRARSLFQNVTYHLPVPAPGSTAPQTWSDSEWWSDATSSVHSVPCIWNLRATDRAEACQVVEAFRNA
jgi:hypothetical protein